MLKSKCFAACLVAAVAAPALGQDGAPGSVIRAGAIVPLKTVDELTTKGKKLRVGDRFKLVVSDAVTANGPVVITTGSPAVGEIIEVRNKGMFGKSGYVKGRVLYARAGDKQIRLTGIVDDKGSKNGVGAGVATYATLVGGFLITGTSALIPAGTPVTAYLDEDLPVK